MNEATKIQEEYTVGPQAIGFDYQFYYFMYLSLQLITGQKVGFEVKDDVHIDNEDGTTTLFQMKHTVLKKTDGTTQNLTTLDADLWKTLSNWADIINAEKNNPNFLNSHFFILITNKNDTTNKFTYVLSLFKNDNDTNRVLTLLEELKNQTTDETLKSYIKNVASIGKRRLKIFLEHLTIETNSDGIISKIKNQIHEIVRQERFIDPVFESLCSNLLETKYTDIKNRKKFEISFVDFNKKFGKCFQVAFENKPLPRRDLPYNLPENLLEQTFIKQLIDIGVIGEDSPKVIDYTRQMLKALNQFSYWTDENFLLSTEMSDFEKNTILIWNNQFSSKYRLISTRLNSGELIDNLEDEIRTLALDLMDFLIGKDLTLLNGNLGLELSNGHVYILSNQPQIGWHLDWEKKYKKP